MQFRKSEIKDLKFPPDEVTDWLEGESTETRKHHWR